MATASSTLELVAKAEINKTAPSSRRNGPNHFAVVNKIKGLFPKDTVKCLATWLNVSIETARHRIKGNREFNLDEIVDLLHAEHGFEILSALMSRAERPPRWWRVCMPLMDLADAERMVAVVRKKTQDAILSREETIDALETEIRRAQALAIHGEEQARIHADALRSLAHAQNRVVVSNRRK